MSQSEEASQLGTLRIGASRQEESNGGARCCFVAIGSAEEACDKP